MKDIILNDTVAPKNNLTARFIAIGIIAIILIVSAMTLGGYYVLLSNGIVSEGSRLGVRVSEVVRMTIDDQTKIERQHITRIGDLFAHLNGIESATIYNTSFKPILPTNSNLKLNPEEILLARQLLANTDSDQMVLGLDFSSLDAWLSHYKGETTILPVLVKLKEPSGKVFSVAKIDYNFKEALDYARHFGLRVMLFEFLCSIMLFLALYFTFRRGIKTIAHQEQKLNLQIDRLSKLLLINKNLQKSMKTASARAVELNEQFLRRVGADLHDGPAQMIGFAVLRLNQVSKHEAANSFGHEFHAVREALEDSLEEIRGISSGLVLPELETISLEECLRKVVTLHSTKSKIEVAQYYQDLPDNIPLPIKICAYRFIQEGLNNAHRHGSAKKCRLSAYMKGNDLIISLKDNGVGFRQSSLQEGGSHLGLIGLKDRVESLGGSFSLNSELAVGTALKIKISLVNDS